jgi:hypothetical protein
MCFSLRSAAASAGGQQRPVPGREKKAAALTLAHSATFAYIVPAREHTFNVSRSHSLLTGFVLKYQFIFHKTPIQFFADMLFRLSVYSRFPKRSIPPSRCPRPIKAEL